MLSEIKSEIYTNNTNNTNNFFLIWHKIASSFTFIKKQKIIDNDLLSELPYYKEDNYYFEKQRIKYKNVSENEKVIYSDDNEIITTTDKNMYGIYNSIYAIRDCGKQSNRFFIGVNISSNETTYSEVLGLIIYFNKDGYVFNRKILNKHVFTYDFRNSIYSTFLCNQSLVFTQSHRDTQKLLIGLNLLSFDDLITHTSIQYT